jgi:hypothetical protein
VRQVVGPRAHEPSEAALAGPLGLARLCDRARAAAAVTTTMMTMTKQNDNTEAPSGPVPRDDDDDNEDTARAAVTGLWLRVRKRAAEIRRESHGSAVARSKTNPGRAVLSRRRLEEIHPPPARRVVRAPWYRATTRAKERALTIAAHCATPHNCGPRCEKWQHGMSPCRRARVVVRRARRVRKSWVEGV